MEKKTDTTPAAAVTADQLAARELANRQTTTSDGSYQVGDRVTIEATVKAITGDQLTLAIDRAPATDGIAPGSTEGASVQLSTKQVRKA